MNDSERLEHEQCREGIEIDTAAGTALEAEVAEVTAERLYERLYGAARLERHPAALERATVSHVDGVFELPVDSSGSESNGPRAVQDGVDDHAPGPTDESKVGECAHTRVAHERIGNLPPDFGREAERLFTPTHAVSSWGAAWTEA